MMKKNYGLYGFYGAHHFDLAAKAADFTESVQSATKLLNRLVAKGIC